MKTIVKYISLSFLLFACSNEKEANDQLSGKSVPNPVNIVRLSPEQIRNAGIVSGMQETREMHMALKVNGVIDVPPGNSVSVSAPLGGYLKKTTLIPGAKVNKGSVLAVLEDQQYIQLQQDYLTARNRLNFLETDYNRQKGLNESKVTSDKNMQQVQSEYTNQRILLRSLAEQLRLIGLVPEKLNEHNLSRSINLYAPISGCIVKVNANIGKYVNPEDVLFELINPDNVCVSLTVFENDASKLAVGQRVTCFVNNNPGVSYPATIELIAPSIGENRAAQVHARLDKHSKDLLPGTFISAEIWLKNTKVQTLPADAVVKWENKNYVFAEESAGTFKMIAVETGNSIDGYVEIKSILPAQKIAVKNAYTLLMKMKNSEEE